jgi:hypothetical protein
LKPELALAAEVAADLALAAAATGAAPGAAAGNGRGFDGVDMLQRYAECLPTLREVGNAIAMTPAEAQQWSDAGRKADGDEECVLFLDFLA